LKDRDKSGPNTPNGKTPQRRDEQSHRQTGRRHENVDTENVENDRAQDRKRQRNVPICQKKKRGHDLQQEKHNIESRYENCAQELRSYPGWRRQGNEVQKSIESECQEDKTKQITRDRRNHFHAPSSWTNKIDLIDIISIDIDISDVEYNGGDSQFYGKPQKASERPSCLVDHAEIVAIDQSLSSPHNERGGVGRVGLSGPRSTAAQGTDAGERYWPKGGSQSRFGQRGGRSTV
jgi:hypothetical protein